MTKATKIILYSLPLIAGAGFLVWYLRKNGKKSNFIPEENPAKAKQQPAKEPTPTVISTSSSYPLKNGVFNSALVAQLQVILNGKGASLTVDGDFGPKTEAALLKYYGKKQIDSAADFNNFRTLTTNNMLVNTKTAKAQVILTAYKKSPVSEVYCTMNTELTVVVKDGSGNYVVTNNTIKLEKLSSFPHERLVPIAITNAGDLRGEYTTSWIGGQTYSVFMDPSAFAVK